MCDPSFISWAPGHSPLAHRSWHHWPAPDWLGVAQSWAEPQSQEGGKTVAVLRGWDVSSAQ